MFKKHSIALLTLVLLFLTVPALAEDYDPKALGETIKTVLTNDTYAIDGYSFDTAELRRFYEAREYKPVWDTNPKGNRNSLAAFLTTVKEFGNYYGLMEYHYPSQQLSKLIGSAQVEDSYKIEILVTGWLLKLGHQLHGDTIKLANIYPGWHFQREPLDLLAGLEKAIRDNRVYDFVASLGPNNPAYHRLARELKAYRAIPGPWPIVGAGPTIHPEEHDSRLPQVRARLVAEGYLKEETGNTSTVYDKELEQAVINYQARNGLKPDGNIGAKTVAAMDMTLEKRIDQIIANMERWRHMPEGMPARYVMVNIADATVEVWDDGKSVYRGPVVVGRPDRKTPFIQSAIRSVIFNPSWHVPAKIARKDILPKLRKDPHYLEKMGFVINGSADDPHGAYIDWNEISESDFNFRLRQSPGDINSLGRLKFDFDNNFAVYMHGTPHKELFDKAERNQSSGCVRLRDPDEFAVVVLAKNETPWPLERVQAEVDKSKTRWLKVDEPLPVYFVYWTVFPGEDDGPLNFRNDVYDYDSFLLEILRRKNIKESPYASKEAVAPMI